MTDSMTVKVKGIDALLERLSIMQDRLKPNSPAMEIALKKVGLIVVSQAKLNLRARGMVDSGRLINSLRFEFFKPDSGEGTGFRIGSFGVPYAALNEFGGPFRPDMRRAMFASLRATGRIDRGYQPKGVIQGGSYIARPFLRTAYATHRETLIKIILDAVKE